TLDHINMATISNFYVMRFNLDGSRDVTFGNNGMAITSFQGSSSSKAVMIQSDGKIVAGGMYAYTGSIFQLALARYQTDGTPDLTFGDDGKVLATHSYTVNIYTIGLCEQANQQLVVATSGREAINASHDFMISRFNPDGSSDEGFGNTGYVLTDFDHRREYAAHAYVLNNGKIFATGVASDTALNYYPAMARYNACGTPISTQPEQVINEIVGADATITVSVPAGMATFQWQKENSATWESLTDGGQYSGTQTDTLRISNLEVVANRGRYRCLIFTGNCTDTSATALLQVNTLSIPNVADDHELRMFPNPAKSNLSITSIGDFKNEDYIIIDPLGRKWLQGKLSGHTSMINIKDLASGIYFIKTGNTGVY
ncbi:MAG: T9SS type A sorting domain-containing protein, partial [Sphingobacteriales bacterium]